MNLQEAHSKVITRRQFFNRSATVVGVAALASLLGVKSEAEIPDRLSHYAPRAKHVIYMFMSEGPSHLDLYDYKPYLTAHDGEPVPESLMQQQRFAFLKGVPNLGGTRWRFAQHGQSGAWFSELLPHIASISDEIALVQSMHTDQFNHDPAVTFMNSGSPLSGRPCMGAWASYGLGSENSDLPAFVVLTSGKGTQPLQSRYWGNGFLPSTHQGVQFRSQGDPVLFVNNPGGMDASRRRTTVDAINQMNRWQYESVGDPEIVTRIEAFELAYRMQTSVPELMDIASEPESVREMYGVEPGKTAFSNNALLARRLVERGVRFVQLFHTGWDHHGGKGKQNLIEDLPVITREVDRGAAALVKDLKRRGLLDETLVIWGGEFGRTPMVQGEVTKESMGRDHNPRAFTLWMAGGGIKPGIVYGATDDFGYNVVDKPVHAHDFQATVLHCLGMNHEKLTYRFQGRDFRLTDVAGKVVTDLLV
ncbi:MAG: DUF1501 domain-containing protein [Candidatus Hydrogenedentes bacterium]|nr:DUF1501 domain-containing protein [Candidatus Hydrogenedentota bacterium]